MLTAPLTRGVLGAPAPVKQKFDKGCDCMRIVFLVGSCLMLIASALMVTKLIKEKKPITDRYLILSIITSLIALRMVFKLLGI